MENKSSRTCPACKVKPARRASRRPQPTPGYFELPTSLPNRPTTEGEGASPVTRYTYKASLIGSAHQFDLTDAGLSWRIGSRSGVWPYADIASVRLSYRPMTMQARRFRADIEKAGGGRIAILSTTWQTVALMAPQDQDYRAFITELHRRMKAAGSKAAPDRRHRAGDLCRGGDDGGVAGDCDGRTSGAGACDVPNSPARCFSSAWPSGLSGRSAASSSATGRAATRFDQLPDDTAAVAASQSSEMKCDFAKPAAGGIVTAEFPTWANRRDGSKQCDCRREAEIAEINARHLIETPLRPADLLFVFGTRADVAERVDEACRLWREGYFRWAIVSGGDDAGIGAFGMRDHCGRDGRARRSVRHHPEGRSGDEYRRERDLLAADHRRARSGSSTSAA